MTFPFGDGYSSAGLPIVMPDPRILINATDTFDDKPASAAGASVVSMVHTIAEAVAPLIVERVKEMLRQSIPAEQRAIADAARSVPGLEAVSIAALADYVEERLGMGEMAARVRKMAVEDGDVIVCQYPRDEPLEEVQRNFAVMDNLESKLAETGRRVVCVMLPDDCSLSILRREDRK